jgi:sarcosine oxidase
MTNRYDAIVLGLGGMGSAAAYQLARRGKRVLGLERHTPAHDKGSSHGQTRIIRQAYIEGPAYVPLVLRAYELWEQIEHDTGRTGELLTVTGGLMMGRQGSKTITGSTLSAEAFDLPHEILDAKEIRRRFGPLKPSSDEIALYEYKAGYLAPEACVAAHLAQAATLGAELHFEEPATSWSASPDGSGVSVTTERAIYHAERLVVAAGPWAAQVLNDLALPLSVERQVLYWFQPEGGAAPFAKDRFPIYIWEADETYADGRFVTFYGFPAVDGPDGPVKVSFHSIDVERCTPATIDRNVRPWEVERMRGVLRERIPSLSGECVKAVTCMYTMTPDEHFVIDLHPAHKQVVVASPCSGHGFKFCSVVGEILADLALDGTTRHDIAQFAIGRF